MIPNLPMQQHSRARVSFTSGSGARTFGTIREKHPIIVLEHIWLSRGGTRQRGRPSSLRRPEFIEDINAAAQVLFSDRLKNRGLILKLPASALTGDARIVSMVCIR